MPALYQIRAQKGQPPPETKEQENENPDETKVLDQMERNDAKNAANEDTEDYPND